MKKYKCPNCFSTTFVICKTKRGHSYRYFCKFCSKCFSVKMTPSPERLITLDHLNGLSFSVLGTKCFVSKMTAWRIVMSYFRKLIHNNLFTFTYCNRFSSVLVPDGKYVPIKGYSRDAVLFVGCWLLLPRFPIIFSCTIRKLAVLGTFLQVFWSIASSLSTGYVWRQRTVERFLSPLLSKLQNSSLLQPHQGTDSVRIED